MKNLSLAIVIFVAAAFAGAQTQTAAPAPATTSPTAPPSSPAAFPAATTAPVSTVSRTTRAMHYRLQGGSTKVDFRGTDLLQGASGEAKVEGKKTNFEIDAHFEGMLDATKFGLEYLTYVL